MGLFFVHFIIYFFDLGNGKGTTEVWWRNLFLLKKRKIFEIVVWVYWQMWTWMFEFFKWNWIFLKSYSNVFEIFLKNFEWDIFEMYQWKWNSAITLVVFIFQKIFLFALIYLERERSNLFNNIKMKFCKKFPK